MATLLDRKSIDARESAISSLGIDSRTLKDGLYSVYPWATPFKPASIADKGTIGKRLYNWIPRVHDAGNGKPGPRRARSIIMRDPVSMASALMSQVYVWDLFSDERLDGSYVLVVDGAWVIYAPVEFVRGRVDFVRRMQNGKIDLSKYDAASFREGTKKFILSQPANATEDTGVVDPLADAPRKPARKHASRSVKPAPVAPVLTPSQKRARTIALGQDKAGQARRAAADALPNVESFDTKEI